MTSARVGILGGLIWLLPYGVEAHAFGQQYSLPLPINLYILGGTIAFLISCVLTAFAKPIREGSSRSLTLPPFVDTVLKRGLAILFVGALVAGIAFGIFGSQEPPRNPLLYIFWIGLVLVVPYLSVLIGGLWEAGNPFLAVVRYLQNGDGEKKRWRHGYAPALTGYALLIILELFFPQFGTAPAVLALILLLYLTYLALGSLKYEAADWIRHAEFFSVFFAIARMLAPLQLRDRLLTLSSPVRRLIEEKPAHLSLLAFIVFALAATAYDGFRETSLMANIVINVLQTEWQITSFAILLLFPLLFFGLYAGAILAMKLLVRGTLPFRHYLLRFAYSLVPIMLAYHFAHYFSLLLTSFGFLIGADIVWYIQLFVIVAGHAYGAYIAHQIALSEFPQKRTALLSQIPLVILMVFYTATGLWILAQPFA